LIVFPNCKINLGLYITGKRPDGYHDIETLFYPIALNDALEVIPDNGNEIISNDAPFISQFEMPGIKFSSSGNAIPGLPADNICIKAYNLIKRDYTIPPLLMHLHKAIPNGAGLGGGSADGAYCLVLLNEKFNLDIPAQKLYDYALTLGSDCPFFLLSKPAIAKGRGEKLTPVELDLSAYHIVIVNPGIHISTAEAFGLVKPTKSAKPIAEIIKQSPYEWKDQLENQFEQPVFKLHPILQSLKEKLYLNGAFYASMTGTGSTIFGLFHKEQKPAFDFPPEWFVKILHG
jgi:4-diphosphocytidyl-2-C-methyl-D-erythritol kinase